jgi:hypothetical protein
MVRLVSLSKVASYEFANFCMIRDIAESAMSDHLQQELAAIREATEASAPHWKPRIQHARSTYRGIAHYIERIASGLRGPYRALPQLLMALHRIQPLEGRSIERSNLGQGVPEHGRLWHYGVEGGQNGERMMDIMVRNS